MIKIVITKPKFFQGEATLVTKFFESGLEVLHVRKPKATAMEIKSFLMSIPQTYWNRIVLHSHHNLAIQYKLKGIHLTGAVRSKRIKKWYLSRYLKWKYPTLHVSTSFHSLAPLYQDRTGYDYIFISPVFDSISKGGYQSAFSETGLKSAIAQCVHKVIALGGVEPSKIGEIARMGFAGFAVLGAIWDSEDPQSTFEQIKYADAQDDNSTMLVDPEGILHIKKVTYHGSK
ncbi:MAG: thiamine phosphate synthase [Flavobacteriales bacterium]|nr:thiamine phosphate synthase [Flavobacteriales bacterium]